MRHHGPVVRRRAGGPVDWEGIRTVTPATSLAAGPDDVHPGDLHDGLRFHALDLADLHADGAAFLDCEFSSCTVDAARMHRGRLTTCTVRDVQAAALDAQGSTWTNVVVTDCRIGALVLPGSHLTRVTFENVRVDFANLRGATATQVQWLGCRIGELDLGGAEVDQARFDRCEVDRLALSGCTLQDVDLRGAALGAVDGLIALAGSLISHAQLVQLAPALADHLGIGVSD